MPHTDPERKRQYQRAWKAKRREEWINTNGPCVDCGTWEDLQVDHVNAADKATHRVFSWSAPRREAELAKCVVRCRPCHVAKTYRCGELPPTCGPGERNGNARFSEADIRAIRASRLPVKALAAQYGTYTATISKIQKRQRWTHVE